MSFLYPGILYGLILAAIPLVLHFLMRARPRHFDFPALRLLENIRKQNSQRMRLRHLGLLLLRIFLLLCLIFAAARPTLPAANYFPTSREWLLLAGGAAVVLVIYQILQQFWVKREKSAAQQAVRTSWLRSGAVAGLVLILLLFLGWPYQQRIRGEIKNPGDQRLLNVPVAAVMLFDISASMGYQQESQTRLARAFTLAQQQIQGLPGGSQIAMADNAQTEPIRFLNDLNSAATRLQRAATRGPQEATFPLNDLVLSAINLQQTHREKTLAEGQGAAGDDRYLREIYLYTDLMRSAWSLEQAARLQAELEQYPWLRVYLIDVGLDAMTNYSLSRLNLAKEQTVQGSLIRLTADVTNHSPQKSDCMLELYLEDNRGQSVKRDQQFLPLEAEQTSQATFTFPAEFIGPVQGVLKLINPDPLLIDNELPFTVQVEPRPRIALVSETPAEAFVWQQALAPNELVRKGTHAYEIELLTPQELAGKLSQADSPRPEVIYLLNVPRLSEPAWLALQKYVESGGGLGVVLGNARIDVANYRSSDRAEWLPALPSVHSRAQPPITLDIPGREHPVFRYLAQLDVLSLFSSAAVHRFWKTDLAAEAEVLARFQDNAHTPAIIARPFRRGNVVLVTTAVDLEGAASQNNWSELARLNWIYTAWADQLTRYLRSSQGTRINRPAGETMHLTLPLSTPVEHALLQMPGLKQGRISLPYRGELLTIVTAQYQSNQDQNSQDQNSQDQNSTVEAANSSEKLGASKIGNYRLIFPETQHPALGFSIHLSDGESDLRRLSHAELDQLLGPDRWQLSQSYEELERSVLLGRIGQEAYPLLITLLLVFFIGEHLVANYFYGKSV